MALCASPMQAPYSLLTRLGAHPLTAASLLRRNLKWNCSRSSHLILGLLLSVVSTVAQTLVEDYNTVTGGAHFLALDSGGKVFSWGGNNEGQLGDGTTLSRIDRFEVTAVQPAKAVAAGFAHSLALREDGRVFSWGANGFGQLGLGDLSPRLFPEWLVDLEGVVAIAAGASHSVAVKSDGTAWTWGLNSSGQLGDGAVMSRSKPAPIPNLSDAVRASAGPTWTTIVRVDGTEAHFGTIPAEFISGGSRKGVAPHLITIVGGNHQVGAPLSFNPQPFDVAVWTSDGKGPLAGIPLTFEVVAGDGKLGTAPITDSTLSRSLLMRTDVDGSATAFFQQPSSAGVLSKVRATTGLSEVVFDTLSTPSVTSQPAEKASNSQRGSFTKKSPRTPTAENLPSDPSTISGLQLWLQGSSASAGALALWADDSSEGNDAEQVTSGEQPTVVANVLNGYNVVRFDGVDDWLGLPDFLSSNTSGEVFIVLKADSSEPYVNQGLWQMGTEFWGTIYPFTDGVVMDEFGSDISRSLGIPQVALDTFNVYNVSSQEDDWVARFNGKIALRDSSNTVAFRTDPALGRALADWFTGDIAEVVIYDRVLDASERETVGSYLAQKYALPSIPAPAKPTLTLFAVSGTQCDLMWSNSAAGVGTVTTIERKIGAGSFSLLAEVDDVVTYADTGLTPGESYTYRVTVRSYQGASPTSDPVVHSTSLTVASPPSTDLCLWLRPTVGTHGPGAVGIWEDQSGNGNHFLQAVLEEQPALVLNKAGGMPVVRFSGIGALIGGDMMDGATEGEIIVVVKKGLVPPDTFNTAWGFGTAFGTGYFNSDRYDDFGTDDPNFHFVGPVAEDYHIESTQISSGDIVGRLNGKVSWTRGGANLTFRTDPFLGGGFTGDLVEVLIYRRVLTTSERESIGEYLTARYKLPEILPLTPPSVAGGAVGGTRVDLSWSNPNVDAATVSVVERKTGMGAYSTIAELSDEYSWSDTSVVASTTYTYRVTLRNYVGVSVPSTEVVISTPAGTIDSPPSSGLRLWLKPYLGAPAAGALAQWMDQSGLENHAVQGDPSAQPSVITSQIVGRPVVRFDGNDALVLPDVMQGAICGEIIAIVKKQHRPDIFNTLWSFGAGYGTGYFNKERYEDFGTDEVNFHLDGSVSGSYHIHNVSTSAGGEIIERLNGRVNWRHIASTVVFNPAPLIGPGFKGDIAEILVYDRVLSDSERRAVGEYFANVYSLPGISIPDAPLLHVSPIEGARADIFWQVGNETGATVTSIERKIGAGSFSEIAEVANETSWSDGTVSPSTTYSYRVKVSSYAGASVYSNTVTITTPSTSAPASSGLRLWLRPTIGTQGFGPVESWQDQSGLGNHATQVSPEARPILSSAEVNGLPAVKFDGIDDRLDLPNVMDGATEGEIFAVLRQEHREDVPNVLWRFGQSDGSAYFNDFRYEDFGTDEQNLHAALVDGKRYHIMNVSIAANGDMIERIDGSLAWQRTGAAVAFSSEPMLAPGFKGALVEILVYDRVLDSMERSDVVSYLSNRFLDLTAPTTVTGVSVESLTPDGAVINWTPSTDNVSVVGYEVYVDAVLAGISQVPTFTLQGLAPSTSYSITVKALDGGGNKSAASLAITVEPSAGAMPDAFPGLRSWFRADDAAAGSLASWPDQSSLGNHATQGDPSKQPTVVANQINGHNAVVFDGTDDVLSLPDLLSSAVEGEIFVYLKAAVDNPGGPNRGLWQLGTWSLGAYYPQGDGKLSDEFGSTTSKLIGDVGVPLDQFNLYNASSSASSWSARMNGKLIAHTKNNIVAFRSDPKLGKNAAEYFDGQIAEVIIFARVLTESERDRITEYLSDKYAAPALAAPTGPENLTVLAMSASRISLSWSGVNEALEYLAIIERKTGGGGFEQVDAIQGALGFDDNGLEPGTEYTYRVKYSGLGGESGYSDEVSVGTLLGDISMPTSGMRLWLRADRGTGGIGKLAKWRDQSGLGNDAFQTNVLLQPETIANQLNGRPVVRFDGVNDLLDLPDVMNGATAGEIFAVIKMGTVAANTYSSLWQFGTGQGSGYYNTERYDDFGTSNLTQFGGEGTVAMGQYHFYNVSATSGAWIDRYNAHERTRRNEPTISFRANPRLGGNHGTNYPLKGDIAEIIVYDRVLSVSEREAVMYELSRRYEVLNPAHFLSQSDLNGDRYLDTGGSAIGISPFDLDSDGDTIRNDDEVMAGTNPLNADTDGDGYNDDVDAFPLDGTRHDPLVSVPGDVTPPEITLTEPANAVPVP